MTAREAGREMDALIAGRVMGLDVAAFTDGLGRQFFATGEHVLEVPAFSTDIAAAFLVVQGMREVAPTRFKNLTLVSWCYGRSYATFDAEAFAEYDAETWSEANGEHHESLVICLAALAALESSPPPEGAE